MLRNIPITDNFEQINAEYKRFKHSLFNSWCEFDQYTLDSEEKKLIQTISSILSDTEGNQEENLIRALIGARALSKYSIMNQKECVNFFPKSDSPFPRSIQKRRFILKCIAKKCKLNTDYEWDNYIMKFQKRILPTKIKEPEKLESVENALIYISFLIQYASDFVLKFSNEIFSHLLKIIQENTYTFDLTYDIFAKTNQTQDQYFSEGNTFYANNAIELLRKILLNIKSIRYQSIDVDNILEWDQNDKLKILAVLSVLLESCGKPFIKQNSDLIRTYLDFKDDNPEIECLKTRNLIFCLPDDEKSKNDFIQNNFSFDHTLDSNIICAMLQNLKLLITNDHNIESQQKIFDIAISFINGEEEIRNNVFDILNTFYLVCDEEESDNLISNSEYTEQIFDTIHFEFIELAKTMIFYKHKEFIEQLSVFLTKDPYKTLLFLNNNKITENDENELAEFSLFLEEKSDDNYILEQLRNEESNDFITNIINPIFDLAENEDPKIRSLVPLVLIKLRPEDFFTIERLTPFIRLLLADPSNQVKLALLQSFNYIFNINSEIVDYNVLKTFFNESTSDEIFRPLLDAYSPQNIRLEAIKFISNMVKHKISSFYFIKKHLYYFKKFTDPANNCIFIQRKLASSSQFLPFIFTSYFNLEDDDYNKFYKFSMDFMNIVLKHKTNYSNQTSLKINTVQKTVFQHKFYETIFCSYIKTIKLFFKIKPDLIKLHVDELIKFSMTCLYYGITELETLYILSLLEQCLYFVGLKKTIEINNNFKFDDDINLYQIVFNTGAHFISPLINKFVFQILGFIGAQINNEKQELNDSIPEWKKNLNYEVYKMTFDKSRRLYFYSICSNCLFNILEDELMMNSHFNALNSLINIQKRAPISDDLMIQEFNRSFNFFKKLLNSTSSKGKDDFVPLLKLLISFNFQVIKESIPDLVQCLIDLWNFGSSSILTTFSSILKLNLSPYLNQIIPLVISLQNSSEIVNLLVSLYENVVFNVRDKKIFFLDIVNLLIQMINEEKYEALEGLNQLIPILIDLYEYVPSIVNTCLEKISNLNGEEKCLDEIVKVLNTLLLNSKNSLATSEIFDVYCNLIIESLGPFPNKLNEFSANVEIMRNKEIRTDIIFPSPKKEQLQDETDYLTFNVNEFFNLVSSINNFIDNDINSLYIQQWLNELIMHCIENSPSFTIRSTFQVAKNNPSFAISIFNIAFYSMINHKQPRQIAKIAPNGTQRPQRPPPKKGDSNKSHIRINGDPRTKAAAPRQVRNPANTNKMQIVNAAKRPSPNNDGENPPNMAIPMPPRQSIEIPFKTRIRPITETFLLLFKMEKMPFKCRTILFNLVVFMDRANAPLFNIADLESIQRPITSIFADNPPLSFLLSLRRYYLRGSIESEKRKAIIDLERAFLNVGLVDQYNNFVRIKHHDPNNNNDNDNDDDNFTLPIFANTFESIHHLKKANDFFLLNDQEKFDEQIELCDKKSIYHLFKTAFKIQNYWKLNQNDKNIPDLSNDWIFNYDIHNEDENYQDKLMIFKEIQLGFEALGHEIGTSFTQGNATTFQSIIYGQQLVELQEMFFSNDQRNDFMIRFMNSDQISNFLHHILLLRIAAKGENKDSLHEKVELFSLSRKSSKWNLMKKYYDYFFKQDDNVPIEIQYEMMYYKLANNLAEESEFDSLIDKVCQMKDKKNDFGQEYEYNTLEKFIKYQKAIYYAHTFNEFKKFKQVIILCNDFDNAEAINLWSWANLKMYRLRNEKKSIYLIEAIKGYIKGSLKSEKLRVSNMISIISLIFTHFPNHYDINSIKEDLNSLPLYYFIDCAPQIISYIHKLNENDESFNEFVFNLLINLMAKYPHGVIYEYNFSIFCDNREKNGKIIKSPINHIRNYFLQNREILQQLNARNIFYQAYELTNNLYKVSSDIKAIMYNLTRYINSFISDENLSPHSELEINDFIKNLDYMDKEYCTPLNNYINGNGRSSYEPNETEKADINNPLLSFNFSRIALYVREIIINFKDLLKLREKYNFVHKRLQTQKIRLHQNSYTDHLKREIIKKPKKAEISLTSSHRPRNCNILTDKDQEYDELNDDDNDDQGSDSIEVEPLLSIQYSRNTAPTLVVYDKNDKVENDIKIESDNNETHKSYSNHFTKPSDNQKQHPTFDVKFNHPDAKLVGIIMKLERIDKMHQKNINVRLCNLSTLNIHIAKFNNDLRETINTSSTQFNMITESPKMEGKNNLCLPVFGTYQHNQDPILIQRFVPKCQSKKSLARPKLIHIIGSNGVDYSFMLKASEDLRADQRFMIFFRFLNRFLNTKIRAYSVTPLTVRFGIIQFVHNTTSLFEMISANRTKDKTSTNCELLFLKKQLNEKTLNDNPYDRLTYIQHYEVLHSINKNFPKRTFDLRKSMWSIAPNGETWVKYTVNYNKYLAVTSIVGYIIGIGDRHLQNILFDMSNGNLVHIDFNDCFETNQQRIRLRERVPFRLTKNLIAALGPCGCNGTFRTSCEETLGLIRENREIIYNILEVFAVSPIQDFGRVKDTLRSEDEISLSLKKNKFIMNRIEKKLNGTDFAIIYDRDNDNKNKLSKKSEVPLSVKEQVDKLIAHASNEYYISSSFTGWRPYL